jgi:FAD/FMN-containing dehydrogenase
MAASAAPTAVASIARTGSEPAASRHSKHGARPATLSTAFAGDQACELWKSRVGEILRRRLALSADVRTELEAMKQLPVDRGRLAELAGRVAELVIAAAELPCS